MPQLGDGVIFTPMTKMEQNPPGLHTRDFGLVDSGLGALQQFALHGALKRDIL